MNTLCPICGMPPLDGEPCCTREYAKQVIRQADRRIKSLESERDAAVAQRDALAKALRKYGDHRCCMVTLTNPCDCGFRDALAAAGKETP